MSRVIDASVAVAALIDHGEAGRWAREQLGTPNLLAPHLLPAEVGNTLRRLVAGRRVTTETAALALRDFADLDIELFPFAPFASRVWQLRDSVTAYDAWYVAVAEANEAPLMTLDARLVRAAGPRCEFRTVA